MGDPRLVSPPDSEAGWRLARLRQAATSGTVHYACLEPSGAALCVAAERPVTLVRDSEKPLPPPAPAPAPAGTPDPAAASGTRTEKPGEMYCCGRRQVIS